MGRPAGPVDSVEHGASGDARPFAGLADCPSAYVTRVDVTSAPFQGGARRLVRRYWLTYSWNNASTQARLTQIDLEGSCSGGVEGSDGLVSPSSACPLQKKILTLGYSPTDPTPPAGPTSSTCVGFRCTYFSGQDLQGPYLAVDLNGDAIPEMLAQTSATDQNGFVPWADIFPDALGRSRRRDNSSPAAQLRLLGDTQGPGL